MCSARKCKCICTCRSTKRGEQSACVSFALPEDTRMAFALFFFFSLFSFPFNRNICPRGDTNTKVFYLEIFVMVSFSRSLKNPLKCKNFQPSHFIYL